MLKNKNLHKAKQTKNDEFYTRIEDISNEIFHYKEYLNNKVVYCNCDDPEWSNFFIYFKQQFQFFNLKKLITTHYESNKPTYKLEYDGNQIIKTPLSQNGDFRSNECIELLKECDVVITNPPFSLWREYIQQLMDYNKDFIIIGNYNAISYKEVFKYIKDNRLWLGVNNNGGCKSFITPNGKSISKVNACWFTNLNHQKRNQELFLYKTYNPNEYLKYDNIDAINVDKVKDIPKDYDLPMGVPISFLQHYNPNQFEILNIDRYYEFNTKPNKRATINNVEKYARIIIRRKQNENNVTED